MTAFLCVAAVASCCKITPPPARDYRNTEASGKVAAELKELNVSGNVESAWKRTVDKTFVQLNDDNAAFYMLFQAIECASKRGDKETARHMLTILDREMEERRAPKLRSGREIPPYQPSLQVDKARAQAVLSL